MSNISKINGLDISAADAQYVAAGNVDGPLGYNSVQTSVTASYISPTFISASAAASGFGSGGGAPATASWAINAITASFAATASHSTTLGASITNPVAGQLRLRNSNASTISTIEGFTASLASTASYLNNLNQNLTITGNLNIIGSASYTYVSASTLDVGTNTISVNVAEPAERFGGLIVYDSGSLSHQATSSFLWDSEKNKWIYQNVSGAGYDGGMAMFGPRNTAGLGNEQGTTNNALMKGQGGDHITSSRIFDDGTNVYTNSNVQITGSLKVTGGVTASLQGTADFATTAAAANQIYIAENTSPGAYSIPVYPDGNWDSNNSLVNANLTYDHSTYTLTVPNITASVGLHGTASYAAYALTASYALSSAGVAGGVTSITAGDGISVDQSTGAVTITNTGGGGGGTNLGLVYAVSLGYLMP